MIALYGPRSGRLRRIGINLKVNTIGAVVGSEILMEIVPDISDLVVEARISPMDIDRVKIGQAAEVRLL